VSELVLRDACRDDDAFLWLMLTHAASMRAGAEAAVAEAQADAYLRTYVEGWGAPGDLGVIAERGGEPIGAVWIRYGAGLKAGAERAPRVAELATAMAPAHRGGGAGTAMLDALVARARAGDAHDVIVLSVRDGNPAVRLYERAGFVTERAVENRVGGVSYAMRLALR
jgi:ribosomal protein S18 acetylase RimI-like enzyme